MAKKPNPHPPPIKKPGIYLIEWGPRNDRRQRRIEVMRDKRTLMWRLYLGHLTDWRSLDRIRIPIKILSFTPE